MIDPSWLPDPDEVDYLEPTVLTNHPLEEPVTDQPDEIAGFEAPPDEPPVQVDWGLNRSQNVLQDRFVLRIELRCAFHDPTPAQITRELADIVDQVFRQHE